jgi:lipooligosaccharide transport system permease protein
MTAGTSPLTALRVTQRNLLVYRRTWRGSVFGSFLTPLLYLGALGVGLGSFIAAQDTSALGGYTYLQFLGPGLLASTCMQTASFEATFPIMGKISWRRNYEAILATPLQVHHLLFGEAGWMTFRLTSISTVFLIVLAIFGIPTSPLALLAIPASILTGLAFFLAIMAFTATQKNDAGFAAIFRFVVNPLFLFSGTFFPVDRLPDGLEFIASLTPLYHGVALVRGVVLAGPDLASWPIHLAYLVVFSTIAGLLAYTTLRRRLVK